jgi:Bacterial Ig-like domain (group 3)/FG-GAP-like repeat
MNNHPALFARYILAFLLSLLTCVTSSMASAQQVGFYPASSQVGSAFGYAVGDLNNDGRDDAVIVRLGEVPSIIVLNPLGFPSARFVSVSLNSSLNAADGSFPSPTRLPTNLYTLQSGVGGDDLGYFVKQLVDINGDGRLDVILFNVYVDNGQLGTYPVTSTPQSVVFFGHGDGTFNPAYVPLTLPNNGTNNYFADMNGDRKADFVTAAPPATGALDVLIYSGDGSGGFSSTPTSTIPVTPQLPPSQPGFPAVNMSAPSIVVIDVNHDGLPDINLIVDERTSGFIAESVHVLTATASGVYQDKVISYALPLDPGFNNRNKITAHKTSLNDRVVLSTGRVGINGEFDPASAGTQVNYVGDAQGAFNVVLGGMLVDDFDGDGYMDYMTRDSSTGDTTTFRVNKGVAGGLFIDGGTLTFPFGNLGLLPTISGPYHFGSGATPSYLLDVFTPIFYFTYLQAIVTRPGPQKQITATSLDISFPLISGQPFTLTATVKPAGSIVPTGTVTFTLDSVIAGTATVNNGVATLVVSKGTTAGIHLIAAEYSGDTANTPSSSSGRVMVEPPLLPKITAVSDVTVKEGQKAVFKVSFSAATTQAAALKLTLLDGTAKGGRDYSTVMKYSDNNGATYKSLASGGTATIKAGVSAFLVQVATLNDDAVEPTETYNLDIDPISGLSAGRGWGIGTIIDKPNR